MPDIDTAVGRLLSAYQAAVLAKDIQALMRLYDPQARVFDAWGKWSYDSADAWQSAAEAWFMSLGTEKVVVSFDAVQSAGSADLAVVSAIVTYAGVSAQGEPLRAMQNRLTWALKTRGHAFRILHEHTSAPIGFDDMKAILLRAPGG